MTKEALIPLPIDELSEEILQKFTTHQNLVISASPGSGKTTRVPALLLKNKVIPNTQKILVLVPRRVAAKYAAERVAKEWGEACGETIGYQFRFEKKHSAKTRLLFITEGLLLRLMMTSPDLKDVACVVLDEFHERHLTTDLAFALLKNLQNTQRPDLKLIVMSATLDTLALANALKNAGIVTQSLTPYPLTLTYAPLSENEKPEEAVKRAVLHLLKARAAPSHHVLVFLPGMAQILKCAALLESMALNQVSILKLHGDLSSQEQDEVFKESTKTKIILSTNIAESSVTIPNVRAVIDLGLSRVKRVSKVSGLSTLITKSISQASASQRAGRAARTGPGQCIRLYSEHDYTCRPAFDTPQIRTEDLSFAVLELLALGLQNYSDLPWYEAPPQVSLNQAVTLLELLGAVSQNKLTALGAQMSRLPLVPRLSAMLIGAQNQGLLKEGLILAARLSEGQWEAIHLTQNLNSAYFPESLVRVMRLFYNSLEPQKNFSLTELTQKPLNQNKNQWAALMMKVFPDRVAKIKTRHVKRNQKMVDEWVMAIGGELWVESGLMSEPHNYIVVVEAESSSATNVSKQASRITSYMPIDEEDLLLGPSSLYQEVDEIIFESSRKSVFQIQECRYGSFVLSSKRAKPKDFLAARLVFVKEVFKTTEDALKKFSISDVEHALKHFQDPASFLSAFARLNLLQEDEAHQDFFEKKLSIGEALLESLYGLLDLSELKTGDLSLKLFERLPPFVLEACQKLLPEKIKLTGGRFAKIHYEPNQKPWVASRLQDFHGLKTAPSLLNGCYPLIYHLLAPNGRAVQVTSDLAGFWEKTYPTLRGGLMRRYPRQIWP